MTTIEAAQEERRSFPRYKALKAVQILFQSGASSFDGIVRNMSEGGAKVILESSIVLPNISNCSSKTEQRSRPKLFDGA